MELVALGFSRAQPGTHPGYFEDISGRLGRLLKDRKPLTDAGHHRIEKGTATTIIQVEIVIGPERNPGKPRLSRAREPQAEIIR